MRIRDYRPEDFPQVEELWRNTGIYTVERRDTADLILQCNQLGGTFLVMENPENHRVVGTSWISFDGRRLFLHHFAIQPSEQGRGYGRSLALRSLEFAREKACPMKLEVHQANKAAIKLYKSLGFEVFDDYDVYMVLDPGTGIEP